MKGRVTQWNRQVNSLGFVFWEIGPAVCSPKDLVSSNAASKLTPNVPNWEIFIYLVSLSASNRLLGQLLILVDPIETQKHIYKTPVPLPHSGVDM